MRSVDQKTIKEEEKRNSDLKPLKTLEAYNKIFEENTEFFSTYNPDVIEKALLDYLKSQNTPVVPKVSKNKYKMKFEMTSKAQSGLVTTIFICVRILAVDDQTVCVEFMRLGGDQISFNKVFKEFKDKELAHLNDAVVDQTV